MRIMRVQAPMAIVAVLFVALLAGAAAAEPSAERGAAVFDAAGCYSCHTQPDGAPLAGGRALETPFGTFHAPNITPDRAHGIGAWEPEDMIRALRDGVSPEGDHYYPAFPYTSYAGMTDADIRDLFAYIQTVEPVSQPNRPHDLSFPFNLRFGLGVWKWLYFEPGRFQPDPDRSEAWNRGAYLVEVLGHCGECHTPRGFLGGPDRSLHLAGSPDGAEGKPAPNITPAPETGLGDWTQEDVIWLLQIGLQPDGDVVGGPMGEVVDHSTSKLSGDDRAAMAAYLLSLPPIEHRVGRAASQNDSE